MLIVIFTKNKILVSKSFDLSKPNLHTDFQKFTLSALGNRRNVSEENFLRKNYPKIMVGRGTFAMVQHNSDLIV